MSFGNKLYDFAVEKVTYIDNRVASLSYNIGKQVQKWTGADHATIETGAYGFSTAQFLAMTIYGPTYLLWSVLSGVSTVVPQTRFDKTKAEQLSLLQGPETAAVMRMWPVSYTFSMGLQSAAHFTNALIHGSPESLAEGLEALHSTIAAGTFTVGMYLSNSQLPTPPPKKSPSLEKLMMQ